MPPHQPLSIRCPPLQRRFLPESSANQLSVTQASGIEFDPYTQEGGPVQILSEGLYISSCSYAETPSVLRKLNVGLVINVASEVVNALLETSHRSEPRFKSTGCQSERRVNSHGMDAFDSSETLQASPKSETVRQHIMHPCRSPDLSPSTASCVDSLGSDSCANSPTELPFTPANNLHATPLAHTLPDYLKINWDHGADISFELPEMLDIIDQYLGMQIQQCCNRNNNESVHKKSVLVACNQGVSRSASLVIACVMKRRQLPMLEAYAFVKARSHCISPHVGLLGQLAQLETKFAS
ncbi:protein-tyrosine phosphatase-like protein [Chytriomyces cf. hyalinus JEL632]|nr:protein-tyrosine phosphatase-like protein [Chytriomyces cf. hyalinus JEL632]